MPHDMETGSPPAESSPQSRASRLRGLLMSPDLAFIMEAHSGLSAKIVEEAGFAGVWASGLSISAMLGLRDNNEASWTQVLDVLEFMADATTLPILVDGDTGYGNFNNVRRLVRKLGERGIAGVCLEDKLFPKTNSFLGERQKLADVEEFCGRLRAGKDSQTDDSFSIVARTEALISGHSMDEALRRAEAYHAAGADAILVHSKRKDASEITGFMKRWDGRCPIVIVPTMYYATPAEIFRQAGISLVIWANHMVRSSITAMRDTAARIAASESLMEVEDRIASVREIFSLTGNDELEAATQIYLPTTRNVRGIVLAASRGSGLGAATAERPKCMVDVRGKPLLHHLLATLDECGVSEVAVVRGYRKEAIPADGIVVVDNDAFAENGEAASLACAQTRLIGETVVVYGDVLFRRYILESLLDSAADVTIVVDSSRETASNARDLVSASVRDAGLYHEDEPPLLTGVAADPGAACGEWIGLLRLSARGSEWMCEALEEMRAEGGLDRADLPELLERLRRKHPVAVHYITGHWLDVDTPTDLAEARNFFCMIESAAFLAAAGRIGTGFYTGVPCSFLTPLINRTASDRSLRYVGAASEGEAVAIAAGAWLAGRGTAVMCQNSGLGNAVNPLTSLNTPFRIPTLLIVTWRGQPGLHDEPQHELMGRITQSLLEVMELPHRRFPDRAEGLASVMEEAREAMARSGLPFALVLEKGSLQDETLDEPVRTVPPHGQRIELIGGGPLPSRLAVLERVLAVVPDDMPIIATTGKAGRELFTLADREQHLYQVGSMGCASPMGLGVAMTSGRRTLVLDGDGAALMKLGSMATIGAYQPGGLLHVLLDNGVHDSTGGQATVSAGVDFAAVALACGYRAGFVCDSEAGFADAFGQALAMEGPVLVHVRIRPGSLEKLGRPTIAPHEVAQRFRRFLAQGTSALQAAD